MSDLTHRNETFLHKNTDAQETPLAAHSLSLTAAPEQQLLGFTVGSWVVNSLDPGIWKSNLTGEGARKEKATVNEGPWGRKMKWPGHTYFNSVPTNLFLSYEGRR